MLRNRPLPRMVVAAVGLALLVPGTSANAGPVPGTGAALKVAASPGTTSTIPDWRMQTSKTAGQAGDVISAPAYSDSGWMTVPARSTVVGNPGHPVRVEGKKVEGPDADWAHLPDPVADAISSLSRRVAELEAELGREKGADVRPIRDSKGSDPAAG